MASVKGKRGGWTNPVAAENGKRGGRPRVFATVRIPIDDAQAALDWLNEQHLGADHPAERGLAFLIAGLWSELSAAHARQKDGTP